MSRLEEMIKRHEGIRLTPYHCSEGRLTIGIGHNIDSKGLPDDIRDYLDTYGSITDDMAERLLTQDIADAEHACRILFIPFDVISENRHDACVDLVFNLGAGKIKKGFPSFLAAVNRMDWERAADELQYADGLKKDKLSGYWVQVGNRAKEIVSMIREG